MQQPILAGSTAMAKFEWGLKDFGVDSPALQERREGLVQGLHVTRASFKRHLHVTLLFLLPTT
jgi:hypothetical protein